MSCKQCFEMSDGTIKLCYECLEKRIEELEAGINRALKRYYKADEQTNGGFVRGSVAWAMEDDLKQALRDK